MVPPAHFLNLNSKDRKSHRKEIPFSKVPVQTFCPCKMLFFSLRLCDFLSFNLDSLNIANILVVKIKSAIFEQFSRIPNLAKMK